MAMMTTNRTLYDGRKNVVVQLTGISDGMGGETNVIKVDASELSPPAKSLAIKKITYDVSGGLVQLLRDAIDPIQIYTLSSVNEIDLSLVNGSTGGDDTSNGDILLTTLGFDAGSAYNITLEMRKKL